MLTSSILFISSFASCESRKPIHSGKGLTEIPKNISKFSTVLDFSRNSITNLTSDTFSHLRYLNRLLLQRNKIKHITDFSFKELSYLRVLVLSFNKLEWIRNKTFHGLEKLKYIFLDNNLISRIERNSFSETPRLSEMTININKLTDSGMSQINGNLDLKILYVINNQLSGISFKKHQVLSNLNFRQNKIHFLKKDTFWNMIVIEIMDISYCYISDIEPDTFENYNKLLKLYMYRNNLEILKRGMFFGLTKLFRLLLQNNQIKVINRFVFDGMPQLKEINLSGNKLTELQPGAFGKMLNLNFVALDGYTNTLKVIDPRIFNDEHFVFTNGSEKPLKLSLYKTGGFSCTLCNCWLRKAVARKSVTIEKRPGMCTLEQFLSAGYLKNCTKLEDENKSVFDNPSCFPQLKVNTKKSFVSTEAMDEKFTTDSPDTDDLNISLTEAMPSSQNVSYSKIKTPTVTTVVTEHINTSSSNTNIIFIIMPVITILMIGCVMRIIPCILLWAKKKQKTVSSNINIDNALDLDVRDAKGHCCEDEHSVREKEQLDEVGQTTTDILETNIKHNIVTGKDRPNIMIIIEETPDENDNAPDGDMKDTEMICCEGEDSNRENKQPEETEQTAAENVDHNIVAEESRPNIMIIIEETPDDNDDVQSFNLKDTKRNSYDDERCNMEKGQPEEMEQITENGQMDATNNSVTEESTPDVMIIIEETSDE